MFGKYNKLKKMYIELAKATISRLEDGYFYIISMPEADRNTIESIAKTLGMAMKNRKRTAIIVLGKDSKIDVQNETVLPVPMPPEPPKIRRKKR